MDFMAFHVDLDERDVGRAQPFQDRVARLGVDPDQRSPACRSALLDDGGRSHVACGDLPEQQRPGCIG
jgi:hypothetical protein